MELREAIANHTDISLRLAKHVFLVEAKGKNMVLSPASIHVALSLLAAGSSGSTKEQLLAFLKSKSSNELNKLSSELIVSAFSDGSPFGGPKLSFINALWVEKSLPLQPTFKEVVERLYKASSNQVDFTNKAVEVTSEVNSWAERKTNGLIQQLLPPGSVDNNTGLIFTNAIYFKGSWEEPFDATQTKEDVFHLLDGTTIKVPFMTTKEDKLIQAYDGFKVLRLPYETGEDERRFSMYFYLPDAKDGLPALVDKISSQSGFIDKHIPYIDSWVGNFKLPRFKLSFGFEASNVLKGLGVDLPFSKSLSGIIEIVRGKLYVSGIHHKSFIEVNEKGTEASAVTAMKARFGCIPDKFDFVADHPFMFLIREDKSRVVLFVGHVMNPLEG